MHNSGLLQWLLPDFPTENPLLNGMFCYICNGLVLAQRHWEQAAERWEKVSDFFPTSGAFQRKKIFQTFSQLDLSASGNAFGKLRWLPAIIGLHNKRTMNKLLTIVLLINVAIAYGQTSSDKQKIADFRNDFLDKVEMYRPDTLIIDTLTFVREKYPNVRLVKTFTKVR